MERNKYKRAISDISAKILNFGLPLILGYFIYLIFCICSHQNTAKEVLIHTYLPWFEYIMMSLCIVVLGAIVFDITKKEIDTWNK